MNLKPNQSLKVRARSTNPLNTKWVNVIIEPTDDEEGSYTIPSYTYLKSNSRSVHVQGLSVLFACIGSGDPVRVLHLYTTNTLDILFKHLLLRHMYNLPLPMLMCYMLKPYALRLPTDGCSPLKC